MFEAIEEPWGTWCVIDLLRDMVADFEDRPLAGLDRHEAITIAARLSGSTDRETHWGAASVAARAG